MTVIKYEVSESRFEMWQPTPHKAWSKQEVVDTYYRETATEAHTIGSFDTAEEAYRLLAECNPDIEEAHAVHWFLRGHLYILERNEYDEDGNLVQGDILDVSVAPFRG